MHYINYLKQPLPFVWVQIVAPASIHTYNDLELQIGERYDLMKLSEIDINRMSQVVYLDIPASLLRQHVLTLGDLSDYYHKTIAGRLFLYRRFGGIPDEYDNWKSLLVILKKEYANWKITRIANDNLPEQTGFYGCTFIPEHGLPVVAFRGSEMLGDKDHRNDYETNMALAYTIETPQQKKAAEYLRRYADAFPEGYVMTGHSLGGNLAMYGAIVCCKAQQNLNACMAFNAPGFNRDFINAHASGLQKAATRLFNYQNHFDLISSIFYSGVEPIILTSTCNPYLGNNRMVTNAVYPHSNFCFKIKDGHFVRSEQKKKCIVAQEVHKLSLDLLDLPKEDRVELAAMALKLFYDDNTTVGRLITMAQMLRKVITSKRSFSASNTLPKLEQDLLEVEQACYKLCREA